MVVYCIQLAFMGRFYATASVFTKGVVHGNIVMSIFEYVSIKILLTQNIMNLTAFVNTWHA